MEKKPGKPKVDAFTKELIAILKMMTDSDSMLAIRDSWPEMADAFDKQLMTARAKYYGQREIPTFNYYTEAFINVVPICKGNKLKLLTLLSYMFTEFDEEAQNARSLNNLGETLAAIKKAMRENL